MAKANRDVVYSKVSLYSPRSFESVPSISKMSVVESLLLLIHIPFVVCYLPLSLSIVSKLVSNKRFKSVDFPDDWQPMTATDL